MYGVNDGDDATKHYVIEGYAAGKAADSFDEYGYIASYADLIRTFGTDTLAATKHYIEYGSTEGRIITFDAALYLATYSDLSAAFSSDQELAKKHYIEYGFNEGRIG